MNYSSSARRHIRKRVYTRRDAWKQHHDHSNNTLEK
jgi:hypothetical protein